MTQLTDGRIPLGALSRSQRALVERYLWLAKTGVRRTKVLSLTLRAGREFRDLHQEGVLALAEAVRSHDPARHGEFATYALARIRFSVSRYAQENGSVIRVPLITQRRVRNRQRLRQQGRECDGEIGPEGRRRGERNCPARLPRVLHFGVGSPPMSRRKVRHHPDGSYRVTERARRLEDRLGDALRETVQGMKAANSRRKAYRRLIDVCAEERWFIPEEESRTSIREIARRMKCSVGRIAQCERKFRRAAAERLAKEELGPAA